MKDEDEIREICGILKLAKNIAVVGLSDNPQRTSNQIAKFLVDKGFNVAGVNPLITRADGIDVYPSLRDVPFEIDIINVFRRSESIPDLVEDILSVKPKTLWLQQGIRNDEAVGPVVSEGIYTIQDKCIAVYYNLCKAFSN